MRAYWPVSAGILQPFEEPPLDKLPRRRSASTLRVLVEKRAHGRCEYCLAPQQICGYRYHLEHIVPLSHGGSDGPRNRALACAACNLAKVDKTMGVDPQSGADVALFDPRKQAWQKHFRWADRETLSAGLRPAEPQLWRWI